jgi:CRISPR-associated endoribonuclease Cas6
MRLYFELTPNTEPVPWNYQHFLIGTLHKWLGKNDLHDGVSLYSMSWLTGGQRKGEALAFAKGAQWFISCFDVDLCKKILSSSLSDPEVCCGMKVVGVQIQENPDFGDKQRFLAATPILARRFDGKRLVHLTFKDPEADLVLTQTLHTKLKQAGLPVDQVQVSFDRTYPKARTKLVTIKGVHNKASLCPVIVQGPPESVSFAWDVGVGHSTGSGFGALC